MRPSRLPDGRLHLDEEDRRQLTRFDLLVAQDRFHEAQEIVEDLWFEAIDAHKGLYQGLANALTAVCATQLRQRRGATEIARRTRTILEPFPRRVLDIDLNALIESMEAFVERGDGPILLLRQG